MTYKQLGEGKEERRGQKQERIANKGSLPQKLCASSSFQTGCSLFALRRITPASPSLSVSPSNVTLLICLALYIPCSFCPFFFSSSCSLSYFYSFLIHFCIFQSRLNYFFLFFLSSLPLPLLLLEYNDPSQIYRESWRTVECFCYKRFFYIYFCFTRGGLLALLKGVGKERFESFVERSGSFNHRNLLRDAHSALLHASPPLRSPLIPWHTRP